MIFIDKLKTIVRSVSTLIFKKISNHFKLSFNMRAISHLHSKWFTFDLNLKMNLQVEENEVV